LARALATSVFQRDGARDINELAGSLQDAQEGTCSRPRCWQPARSAPLWAGVPRGELFFVLVLLVLAQVPTAWSQLPLALAVAVGSASLSVLLGVLWHPREDRATLRLDRLHHRAVQGFVSLDRSEHCVLILVAATGVLAAWLLAVALGVGHPFWAPVTVAALLPTLASVDVYHRMVHLVLGTLLGVGLAAVLFAANPGHLTLIMIIVLCQIAIELFIARQYGVALMFLSPLAIGMSNLSRDLPWRPLLVDRSPRRNRSRRGGRLCGDPAGSQHPFKVAQQRLTA
jgi:Fusaric acid resistance protein-like